MVVPPLHWTDKSGQRPNRAHGDIPGSYTSFLSEGVSIHDSTINKYYWTAMFVDWFQLGDWAGNVSEFVLTPKRPIEREIENPRLRKIEKCAHDGKWSFDIWNPNTNRWPALDVYLHSGIFSESSIYLWSLKLKLKIQNIFSLWQNPKLKIQHSQSEDEAKSWFWIKCFIKWLYVFC